nr:hypothetical protein CFP56_46825 [Quercus suber]POE87656.1 hypothetical protein CFP56_30245 [Quercus suber]
MVGGGTGWTNAVSSTGGPHDQQAPGRLAVLFLRDYNSSRSSAIQGHVWPYHPPRLEPRRAARLASRPEKLKIGWCTARWGASEPSPALARALTRSRIWRQRRTFTPSRPSSSHLRCSHLRALAVSLLTDIYAKTGSQYQEQKFEPRTPSLRPRHPHQDAASEMMRIHVHKPARIFKPPPSSMYRISATSHGRSALSTPLGPWLWPHQPSTSHQPPFPFRHPTCHAHPPAAHLLLCRRHRMYRYLWRGRPGGHAAYSVQRACPRKSFTVPKKAPGQRSHLRLGCSVAAQHPAVVSLQYFLLPYLPTSHSIRCRSCVRRAHCVMPTCLEPCPQLGQRPSSPDPVAVSMSASEIRGAWRATGRTTAHWHFHFLRSLCR